MKRLIGILAVLCCVVFFYGLDTRFGNDTHSGDHTFPDSTTLNKLTVQGKATFEDTVDTDDAVFSGRLYGADFRQFDTLPLDSVTGYCTFTFDDCHVSIYDSVFSIFEDSSIVGVMAVPINNHTMGGTGWERLTELSDAGWEIASHSMTHANLLNIPQDSADWELRVSKDSLNAHGYNVKSFVYPGGYCNESIKKRTAKYYRCARTTAGNIERYPIKTYNLQGLIYYYDSLTYKMKAQMDTAAASKGWTIIYMHMVSDTNISTDSIRGLIKYANTKGLKIVTLKQGLANMSNQVETEAFKVGRDGGVATSTRNRSVFYGTNAGLMNRPADSMNTLFGYQAGRSNMAKYNSFFGYNAGYYNTTGTRNTFFGRLAGYKTTTKPDNTFIGDLAGINCRDGGQNTYIGSASGPMDSVGLSNVGVGYQSAYNMKSGRYSTFIGTCAGYSNDGYYGTMLGYQAGYTATGNSNICIGYQAGYYASGHNNLYIQSDSSTTKPLIYGNFASKTLHFSRTANDTIVHIDTTQFRSVINGVPIIKWDSLGLTGSAYIRGTDTFGGTKTADTVVLAGATANDFYWIQGKGATPWTQPLAYVAKANSLIVNCVVGDTAKATASGYNWLRMR